MRDPLLHHYEAELRFIRKLAGEFAEAHPDVASGLQLDPTRCDDPHVERMIEAAAMLAARIQLRLDDDFSEISQALLEILYPHYLRPIPSITMVQFEADPKNGAVPGGVHVPRNTTLHAKPVKNVRAVFRTAQALDLWPLEVTALALIPSNRLSTSRLPQRTRSAVQIHLEAPPETSIASLEIDRLRFFLPGEGGTVPPLYALMLRNPLGLLIESGGESLLLGPEHVRPSGFDTEETLLEYPASAHPAYRVLQEYFVFPEKFQFVELSGIDRLPAPAEDAEVPPAPSTERGAPELRAPGPNELRLSILLDESSAIHQLALTPDDIRLGCTPAINLFRHTAEPVRISHTQSEYEVVPNLSSPISTPGAHEIYSVERVTGISSGLGPTREFYPFYALRHSERSGDGTAFWHSMRRVSLNTERSPSQVFLSLVDPAFDLHTPGFDTLTVETLCTNGELPARLEFGKHARRGSGSWERDFDVEGVQLLGNVRCLRSPTPSYPAPVAEASRWRIISHLAVNHLSISGDGEAQGQARGLEALHELMSLYDFADSALTRSRIRGLVGVTSKRIVKRIGRGAQAAFVRGVAIELEFDPDQYTGASIYLLASVLETFLGLYTAVNSFTQTTAVVRGREGVLKRWPPRSGRSTVL